MRFGRYEVTGTLGKGGMGVVYSARAEDGRVVAVKVLAHGLSGDSRARFSREVEGLARLDHAGIVALLDVGTTQDGKPYLVMPLVAGHTLHERLRAEGPLREEEAARIARELACALDHAHERGVLHRDVKPSNVLLGSDGKARLVDFGLARLLDGDDRISVTGEVTGTPAYMAPEQAEGKRARTDPRTDVYGLGATLYEMLTGAPPLRGNSLIDLLNSVVSRAPAPVATLRHDVTPALAAVVERCLEKDPAARYPTAAALADALAAASAVRPTSRSAPLVAIVATGLVAFAVGAFFIIGDSGAATDRRPRGELDPVPTEAETARARGQLLLDRGDPAGAIRSLERAVALGATGPDVLTARARARLAVGDTARALGAALAAAQRYPTHAPAHVQVALARRALNDRRGALLALDRAVELTPRDHQARRARANERLFLGDFAGAEEDATIALEVGSKKAEDWALRGTIRLKANDRQGALEDTRRLLEVAPDDAPAHRMMGALLTLTGDAAGSYAAWTEAVRLDPEHTDTRRERAMVLLALTRETEALGEVNEVLARNPTDGQALLMRGAIHERRKEFVDAYEDLVRAVMLLRPGNWHVRQQARNDPLLGAILRMGPMEHDTACAAWMAVADAQVETTEVVRATERALAVHPRCHEVLGRRALMWFKREQFSRAAADARGSLATRAGHALANTVVGLLALREGRFDDAIAATTSALDVSPRLPAALGARGHALVHAGQARRGLADADAALEVEPGLVIAREVRAEALRALGDREGALAECQRALDVEPRSLGPRVVRGWVLLDGSDAKGALDEANHVIAKDARSGRGYGLRAAAREALADLEGARADCEHALKLLLLPPHRGEVEARLRRLESR